MRNSDSLYRLIHSLTKSEKRQFKIYTSLQAGNKMYIKLFDLIEKQMQYDEKELKSELKIKAFPVAKIYLYDLILKSLRLQEHRDNKKKLVLDLLENAENLLKKGLYDQSYKELIKAKKIAQKIQQFCLLIEIKQLEHAIANTSQNTNRLKELYNEGNEEFYSSLTALKEQFEYRKGINLIIYKRSERGKTLRNENEKRDIENKIVELLNKNPEECLSFKARIFHYNLNELFYFSNNNFQEAYNQSKKAIDYFESNPFMLTQEIGNYINSMNNLMNSLMAMKKYEEMMQYIQKMNQFTIDPATERARIFAFAASRQIIYYTFTNQHQKGIEFISGIENEISKYESILNHPVFFALCCNLEEFYFVFGNFKKALYWNNRMLNHSEIKLYYDFYSNARISEIIIHYELENTDINESLVKSYQSFLKKNPSNGKFESACLHFFKQITGSIILQKRKQIFIDFLTELKELSTNSYETEVFDIFDIQSWLQSKIDGRAFSEVLLESNK